MRKLRFSIFFAAMTFAASAAADPSFVPALKTNFPDAFVLPHGGELELTLINDDKNTHCAVLPSNGDYQFIWLVNHSKGKANLTLDGPGYYWYGSRTGNDEGRGLTAAIVVQGDAPDEAKIDRPPQPQP